MMWHEHIVMYTTAALLCEQQTFGDWLMITTYGPFD